VTEWQEETVARDEEDIRWRHEQNRVAWNQGASHYTETLPEAIEFLRGGGSSLHPVERANLGDLSTWCTTAIHLQCASGRDTLSLWNEGVKEVIGVDISDVHISNAHQMSDALGAPADWYRCDILDTPHELDGTADLVYTGRGALCWIADIDAWAGVVARLLKPSGVVHVLDDHPVTWLFRQDAATLQIEPGMNLVEMALTDRGWGPTYIGDLGMAPEEHAEKHERVWPLSAVVMVLLHQGLVLEYLGEHREGYWEPFPLLPPEELRRFPKTFSLLARRPMS